MGESKRATRLKRFIEVGIRLFGLSSKLGCSPSFLNPVLSSAKGWAYVGAGALWVRGVGVGRARRAGVEERDPCRPSGRAWSVFRLVRASAPPPPCWAAPKGPATRGGRRGSDPGPPAEQTKSAGDRGWGCGGFVLSGGRDPTSWAENRRSTLPRGPSPFDCRVDLGREEKEGRAERRGKGGVFKFPGAGGREDGGPGSWRSLVGRRRGPSTAPPRRWRRRTTTTRWTTSGTRHSTSPRRWEGRTWSDGGGRSGGAPRPTVTDPPRPGSSGAPQTGTRVRSPFGSHGRSPATLVPSRSSTQRTLNAD